MPYVPRPGFAQFYEDRGPSRGPAVALMPSLLCDATMFAHLAAALETRFRVLVLELRGHGRTGTPPRQWTLEDMADDLTAVLDHAGVERAALVGLSQGGFTAMRAALYHPRRVRALVLMSSSSEAERSRARAKYLALAWSTRAFGVTAPVARAVVPLMFSDAFIARRPDVVAECTAAWGQLDRAGVQRATHAVAMRTDIASRLGQIASPTLVVAGLCDRALPPPRSERIARGIPGAVLERVEGAGHLSTIEQPERTTEIVRGFLERLD